MAVTKCVRFWQTGFFFPLECAVKPGYYQRPRKRGVCVSTRGETYQYFIVKSLVLKLRQSLNDFITLYKILLSSSIRTNGVRSVSLYVRCVHTCHLICFDFSQGDFNSGLSAQKRRL